MSKFLPARRRGATLAAWIGTLACAHSASADDARTPLARPESLWIQVIPDECGPYMTLPAGAPDPMVEWEQALSLAACLQDGPVAAVRDPEQIPALVEELTLRLELPMMIYLQALAEGPPPIQLRAAFHIGTAQLALSTRARSAIAAPLDVAPSTAAALHARALRGQLEPLLVPSREAAWIAFSAIGQAVALRPALASDLVARNMIRTARELLAGLGEVGQVRSR